METHGECAPDGGGKDIGGGGFSPASRRPHWRKSLRNPNINYRNGWFFVTTQVAHNKCILGALSDADEIWTGDLSDGGMLRAMLQLFPTGG
ncbi:MAG: hypothetical protein IKQ55_02435 [Kiritimatiellae bacterium]|nr:hypothetical protein [Kiritimatiellia bacterium]